MITITLAPCLGVDKPFAAVTKETVALMGADVPDGLQLALFDGSGTCLAVADIIGAQAELDLDTQQAVDATTPAAPGEAVTAWLVIGDKDTHIATLPCKLIRNLIDDGAVHPSVPAERYPTVDELAKWLEEAGVIAGNVTSGAARAEQAAQNASAAAEIAQSSSQTAQRRAQEATSAKNAAAESASRASQSANSAGQFSSRASDHANKAKRSASDAENYAMQAQGAKGDASRFAKQASGAKDDALAAKRAAETAADNALESENAARQFSKEAADSASEAIAKHNAASDAHADIRRAIDTHSDRRDNPHEVTAAQVGALTEAAANGRYVRVPPDAETIVLNHLLRGLRFYAHNDAEAGPDGNSPFFVIGSQLSGGQLREDRWLAKLFYNAIEFLRAPGTERVRLEFNRPGAAARATSDAIVLWKEMVAALAEATEGLIGADGGTVGGVLRMKNPKIATDDDTAHDIALVPNGGGQGLQVQFPGGSTAMIRMKTGTLATTEEVKDGLAAKQDKLVAGENVTLTAQADGTVKIDAENNAIPKNMATGRFPNGTEKPIIDIVWDVESIYGRYAYYFSAFLDNSQVVKFLIGQDGSGSLVEREVPTKAYVDGLVGDIDAALAQI